MFARGETTIPGEQQDDDQEQSDKTDGDYLVSLLHILHDVVREGIELLIRHARIAVVTCKLILFLLKCCFEAINADTIVFRNRLLTFRTISNALDMV